MTRTDHHHDTRRVMVELAVEAAGIGSFDWDLTTGVLSWDDRLLELFGYERETFDERIEGFFSRLHPDDVARVTAALDAAIAVCGDYEAEYRVMLPDGRARWLAARGRALGDEHGRAVRVLGAALDTTSRQEGGARVARVLESMSTAFFSVDRDWRFTYVNAEAERVLSQPREDLLGASLWERFPGAVGSEFERHYRQAMRSRSQVSFDAFYPAPLNAWFEVRAEPGPDGLSVYFLDVSDRRAAHERAERALRRSALVAEVTSELSGILDSDHAVGRLAQLVVPALAQWCVVTLVDDEHAVPQRGLRDVGTWHADPAQRETVRTYSTYRLGALQEQSFLVRALKTGRPVTVPSDATETLSAVLAPGRARSLLRQLAPEYVTVLPLRARDRTVGLLSLFSDSAHGPLDADDLATATEVAGRAALALDNARLYRQQQQIAEGLQRSLLTAPPEPDHAEIVVRYAAAAEAARVGGDWYDAFLQPDGATVLVIGDVLGHDTAAAAAMGQIRSLLRGIAVVTGSGPGDLLRHVDRAMRTLLVETTATAVVARLEQSDDERARGVSRLRWSNAGHPPPMVINPDGTVLPLVGVHSDLLLGIDPDSKRIESEVTLDRGATVLLFTDGLVERRNLSLEQGLSRLREVLEQLADRPLKELCDTVMERMVPGRREDDVAVVAVRLHPQDRPRPAEAGPRRTPPDVPDEPNRSGATAS